MITLGYTLEDMISSLQKIGYEIKKETEIETVGCHPVSYDVERSVYNCYYKGDRINTFDWKYGTDRLQMIFELEFRKRALRIVFNPKM